MDVIVNADDLGIKPAVNEATFDLMARGLVTSATIIANGPSVVEACEQISRFPRCSFGVHLNVTEFHPLSGSEHLGPILDSHGAFEDQGIRRVPLDSDLSAGIFLEFCTQIEKLLSLGVSISHIDSHHYVLSIPRMFPILKKVQRRYKIRKARISRNIYADGLVEQLSLSPHSLSIDPELGSSDISRSLRIKKWAYNFMLRNYYRTKTTNGFSGFRLFYEHAKLRKMRQRTFEVVVHPENPYYDLEEVEILTGPWRETLGFPVRLISYHDLN